MINHTVILNAFDVIKKQAEDKGLDINGFKVNFMVDAIPACFVGYVGGMDDKGVLSIEFHLATTEENYNKIKATFDRQNATPLTEH